MRLGLQDLLSDRFQFRGHRETRQRSVYELLVATRRSKLTSTSDDEGGRKGRVVIGNGLLRGEAAPVALLAQTLSRQMGAVVLDRTGLAGKFDFELRWSPDAPDGSAATADGPTVFTAVQEQLGLKLESAKGPVEVLVVDHIERPSPN